MIIERYRRELIFNYSHDVVTAVVLFRFWLVFFVCFFFSLYFVCLLLFLYSFCLKGGGGFCFMLYIEWFILQLHFVLHTLLCDMFLVATDTVSFV